jgi:hypothetical protein
MKRISVLTLLTLVAMLVFASAAFASAYSTYVTWDPAYPNNNPDTPHKGYAINTNKCAVCHAVHKGYPGGEVLLRSTVSEACDYCHINSNIGGDRIYGGNADNHNSDLSAGSMPGGFAHNNACTQCHSVHGANTMGGAKSSRILYDWADADAPTRVPYSTYALMTWTDPANEADGDGQITAWCTGCHTYYTPYYADGSATGFIDNDERAVGPQDDMAYQSHIMTTNASFSGVYDNPQTTEPDPVAWAPSVYCVSCHDAPNNGSSLGNDPADGIYDNHFPHYTTDYYRFMDVATSTAVAGSTNTTGTIDGLCLKCHRDATDGVGITY